MTVVLTIIGAVLIFGLLITIHEFGHYIVARRCGVYIEEFSIGMGPKLYQRKMKKYDTLFSVRAFPIGGYVGMREDEEDEDPSSFNKKNVWQRILIVAAGALMNLLLGLLVVFVVVCLSGGRGKLASTTIGEFVQDATSCAEGGLLLGDTVLRVGDVRVYTGEELFYEIMDQGTEPLSLTVRRGEETVVLENVVFPQFEEQGTVFGESDFRVITVQHLNANVLFRTTWHRATSLVKMVWDGLINLITGRYSVEAISSPIGVTAVVSDTIQNNDLDALDILRYVLNITAMISINLGVFNLIPFPALDGGRLFFLIIEAIIRRPVPKAIEARIHFIGIVLLMLLSVFVIGKDVLMLILK